MMDDVKPGRNLYYCLDLILGLYDKPKTVKEVLAGLPVDDHCLSLKAFLRATEVAGINSQIKKLPLKKLLQKTMPIVIFISGDEVVFAVEFQRYAPGSFLQEPVYHVSVFAP